MAKIKDTIEQELKFALHKNYNESEILNVFGKFGKIWAKPEEGVKPADCSKYTFKDIYLDVPDLCLAKHGFSYRVRKTSYSKKLKVNYKFPGEQNDGLFVRREVRQSFKKYDNFEVNDLKNEFCEVSKLATSFVKEHSPVKGTSSIFETLLYFSAQRKHYHLETENWGDLGTIIFETGKFHVSESASCNMKHFELEFELNINRTCGKTLVLLDEIKSCLLEYGLIASQTNKYIRGLKLYGKL